MKKHKMSKTIKSIFASHIDHEKYEELKGTNIEMEGKVQKILKLIKDKDVDENTEENSEEKPLAELIQDFHKHYQSLYERYNHLTGELREKVHTKKSKNSSSSSSSDSDSDHSPRKKGSKNGKAEFHGIAQGMKHELEAANLEIGELKRKNEDISREKDMAVSCIEEENKISEHKVTNMSRLLNAAEEENRFLSLKVQELSAEILSHKEMHETHKSESMARTRDLELNLELVNSQKTEIEKQKDDELSALKKKVEEREDKVLELESVLVEKGNEYCILQKKLEDGETEASSRLMALEEELNSLIVLKTESGTQLEKQAGEISDYIIQIHTLKEELAGKTKEQEKTLEEKENFILQVKELEVQLNSARNMKTDLEEQLGSKSQEAVHLKEEKEGLQAIIHELEGKLTDRGNEVSSLQKKVEEGESEASAQLMALTAQVSKLEENLNSLQHLKSELEEHLGSKTHENVQLQGEKEVLQVKILELEAALIEKRNEISTLQKKTEDEGNEASARITVLTEQVSKLEEEIVSLNTEKGDSEVQLQKERGEISDYLILVQALKEELTIKNADLEKFMEQKEEFLLRVKELEVELNSLRQLKSELEEQLGSNNHAVLQLHEEKGLLTVKILELEAMLMEKGNEISCLQKKNEDREIETSAQIVALTAEVGKLEGEISSLNAWKIESGAQMEKQKVEISEYVNLVQALKEEMAKTNTYQEKLIEENEELGLQVKKFKVELDSLKDELESKSQENVQLQEEKEALQVKVHELDAVLLERGNEISLLHKKLEDVENESSAQVTALIAQVNNLQEKINYLGAQNTESETQLEEQRKEISSYLIQIENLKEELGLKKADEQKLLGEKDGYVLQVKELESEQISLRKLKSELEEELLCKNNDNVQLQEEKEKLQAKILEMEVMLEEKGNDLTSFKKKSEEGENEASVQIQALTEQIVSLQEAVDILTAKETELQSECEKRSGEISVFVIQIENLREEVKRTVEEKEGLMTRVKDLEKEVESLSNDKCKLEEEAKKQIRELDSLQEEKNELEKTSMDRGEEVIVLQKQLEEVKNEAAIQIETLNVQIKSLRTEMDSVSTEKTLLESLVERAKDELVGKTADHEELFKAREIELGKLSHEHKRLEEIVEDFNKSVQVKDLKVDELEEHLEDLRREVEIKADEISTLVENVRNLEVKLRLSNQKLRITEQMLTEKEEDHKQKETKILQENKFLQERIGTLNGVIATYKETQVKVIAEITEKVNVTFTGIDTLTMKFEEDYGHIETCVFEILNELQIAKNLVKKTNGEREKLQKEGMVLKEKVGELKNELQRNASDKENLMKSVKLLEEKMNEKDAEVGGLKEKLNEKDKGILGIGEEKKEAIRQLCIWIDYHRNQCDDLKELLSKAAGARRQRIRA